MDILEFTGDNRWLSNFYSIDVYLDNIIYPSTEHAYQAAKTVDRAQRKMIREAPTFRAAKALGYKVTLRSDWEAVKLDVMYQLLKQKFSYKALRDKLVNTGTGKLVEGNSWGDRYWGVCDGVGQNHLGKLLMRIRSEIVEGKL